MIRPQAVRPLLSSIRRYVESISEIQGLLRAVQDFKHPLVEQILRAYALDVKMFALLCYEFIGTVSKNPSRKVPLEHYENVFLSAKAVARDALATAEALKLKDSKAANEARKTAAQAVKVAREVAKILADEMRARNAWSKRIVDELELEEWL